MDEFGAFLDELGDDADGDFLDALGLDLNADGAGDALELFGRGDFFVAEMFEDNAGLACAADHAEKQKRFVNPVLEDEGVVAMAAGDDEREGRHVGRRQGSEFFPGIHLKMDFARKILMAGERGAVVENGDVEIKLESERGDGLGDVTGTGDPEFAGRADGFRIKKWRVRSAECGIGKKFYRKIGSHTPRDGGFAGGEFGPELRPGINRVGKDEAEDFAAADEAVVPAEVVVKEKIEGGGLAGAEGIEGAMLDFGFEAATAERAADAAIGKKEGLGADLLGAGTLDAGDECERDAFAAPGGVRKCLENDVLHDDQRLVRLGEA